MNALPTDRRSGDSAVSRLEFPHKLYCLGYVAGATRHASLTRFSSLIVGIILQTSKEFCCNPGGCSNTVKSRGVVWKGTTRVPSSNGESDVNFSGPHHVIRSDPP